MSDDLVKECLAARDEPRPYQPPSETKRLTLAEAYATQDRLREALVGRGERVAGWKAGFTSKAGQEPWQGAEAPGALFVPGAVRSRGAQVPPPPLAEPR